MGVPPMFAVLRDIRLLRSNPAIAERFSSSPQQSLRSKWIGRSTVQCDGAPSPRAKRSTVTTGETPVIRSGSQPPQDLSHDDLFTRLELLQFQGNLLAGHL